MTRILKSSVTLSVITGLGLTLLSAAHGIAAGDEPSANDAALSLSPVRQTPPGILRVKSTTVRFENEEYGHQEAIGPLMDVVLGSDSNDKRKKRALRALQITGSVMKGKPCIIALQESLAREEDPSVKIELLLCLAKSEDERALTSFRQVQDHEADPVVRLFAALSFALWNERSGVSELITIVASDTTEINGRALWEIALSELNAFNRDKNWGFPAKELTDRLNADQSLTKTEQRELAAKAWQTWFQENASRFPTWTPAPSPADGQESPPTTTEPPAG